VERRVRVTRRKGLASQTFIAAFPLPTEQGLLTFVAMGIASRMTLSRLPLHRLVNAAFCEGVALGLGK
jgi:hypothetical protein